MSLIEKLSKEAEGLPEIDAEAFYAHGYALYRSGQAKEAADTFRILCMRRPLDSRFWFALGASLQESDDWKRALHAWAMAALLDPKDPYPHFHAAQCSRSLNQLSDARAALNEAKQRISDDDHPLASPIETLANCWNSL